MGYREEKNSPVEVGFDLIAFFIPFTLILGPCLILAVLSNNYQSKNFTVAGLQWKASVKIRTLGFVTKRKWDTYPKGARLIDTEDQNNRKIYTYEVEEWVDYQTISVEGKKGEKIRYPTQEEIEEKSNMDLKNKDFKIVKEIRYILLLSIKDKTYKKQSPKSTWEKLKLDEKIKCKINGFGDIKLE